MVMTGAVGLVGMALVRAVEVGASITSVPTNGTIYFTRILNLGSQGSPRQTGCDVQKASDEHQGGVLAVGQPQAVASTQGADGIQFLASSDLVLAGQPSGEVTEIDPSKASVVARVSITPATAAVGRPISDTATISRLAENPAQIPTTDTVSFQVVSSCPATPNTPPVAGTVLFDLGSFPVTITAQGAGYVGTAAANPASLPVPASAGTYYWNVSFSGDAYNAPISNQCGEPVVLGPTTPTITTTPSPGGAVGTTLTDTATISGLFDPVSSDQVDFSLYSNSSCSAGALVQDLGSVSLGSPNNGVWTVQSPGGDKPSVAQTYYWGVTFTPAEDPNNPSATVCGEPVTLTSAGGVLGASTGSTPTTGAGLLIPGILASLFLLLGGFVLSMGLRLRRRASV